jgi:hypothetical protein
LNGKVNYLLIKLIVMLKIISWTLFAFFVLDSQAQNTSTIETEIRRLEQEVVKGILDADSVLLKTVWDTGFMVNTPRNVIAPNRAAVLEVQKLGMIDYSSFERIIEEIRVEKNTVITMGYEIFVSRTDIPGARAGQAVKRRFTNIWMKKKGKWLQVARHASIICGQE